MTTQNEKSPAPEEASEAAGFAPVSPDTRQNELINVANQVFDRYP
ncbi:hypothetical protein [Burkholderia cenocepacia]|nr:hypothetical protein [Burkholderia cenocepacia]